MADGRAPSPADLTATEALAAIRRGEVSEVGLVTACLDRIAAADGDLRAWAHVDREGALRTAEALMAHRKSGRPVGALHGLPVGVKDIIDVAGMPCENGTPLDRGRVPRRDAEVVLRLRRLGAVILGKTATTELAGYPPAATRNPHAADRTPGGSSAGSAAAVASGMVPFAIGTQTNGSVIRPASFCGAVGFKPSFGAIPRTGILPVAPSLDHVGVFARSVEDAALAGLLTGPDGADAETLPYSAGWSAVAESAPPVRPSFAWFPGPVAELMAPGTAEAFAELIEAIPGEVPTIASPGPLSEIRALIRTVMAAEGAQALGHYVDRGGEAVHPVYRELIAEGRRLPAPDYLRARDLRGRLAQAMAAVLSEVDAIVTPATPGEAPARETTGDPAFCSLWSFTGLPAITLPLLTGPAGLPLGVQLIGAPGDDARLLRTARWLVRALASEGGET